MNLLEYGNMAYFGEGIAGEFKQGQVGSCQTLSVINALMQSEAGRAHLESLITEREGGNYEVRFPGQAPISISRTELDDPAISGVKGALGVEILEAAAIKHNEQTGVLSPPHTLLTGEAERIVPLGSSATHEASAGNAYINALWDEAEKGHAIITLSAQSNDTKADSFTVVDAYGNPTRLPNNHAYTAIAEGGFVYLENPFDTSERIVLTRDQTETYFARLTASQAVGETLTIPETHAALDAAAIHYAETYNATIADTSILRMTYNVTDAEIAAQQAATGQVATLAAAPALPNFFAGWSDEEIKNGTPPVPKTQPAPALVLPTFAAALPAESPPQAAPAGIPTFLAGLSAESLQALNSCGMQLSGAGLSATAASVATPGETLAAPMCPTLPGEQGISGFAR